MYRLFPRHGGSACPPFGPLLAPFGYRVIGAGWLEGEGIEPTADGFNPLLWERCPGGDYEIQWSFRERPILAGEFSRPLFLSVDPERGPGGGMWLGLYRDGPHPLSQLIGLSPFSEVCADDDLDQICNQSDPCRFTPNMNSFEDSDRDGIPNECQCGDPNQSGSYEGADLLAAHECLIEDADAERSPCAERVWKGDTDGDGRWANGDLIRIRGTLIGNQPGWALSCPARPEGTPPPRALHD